MAKDGDQTETGNKRRRSTTVLSAPKQQRKSQGPAEAESSSAGARRNDGLNLNREYDDEGVREIAEVVFKLIEQCCTEHDHMGHEANVHYANLACSAMANDTDIVRLRDTIREEVEVVTEEKVYPLQLHIGQQEIRLRELRQDISRAFERFGIPFDNLVKPLDNGTCSMEKRD